LTKRIESHGTIRAIASKNSDVRDEKGIPMERHLSESNSPSSRIDRARMDTDPVTPKDATPTKLPTSGEPERSKKAVKPPKPRKVEKRQRGRKG
jgi:hypothetical protein